jgi:hypothetical protein
MLWSVVGVVGAAFGRIILPQLYSRTGNGLLGCVSELMVMCVDRSVMIGSLFFSPFFIPGEINFLVCRWHLLSVVALSAGARWFF